jgi:hypothetical protein
VTLVNLAHDFPYLVESLAILVLATVGLVVLPRHRAVILLGGILCTPNAALSLIHVPSFWNPVFFARYGIALDDVVWLLAAGMLTTFFAILPFSRRATANLKVGPIVKRYCVCALLEAVLLALALAACPDSNFVMYPTIGVMLVVSAILLWLRPAAWPFAVAGSLGYGVFHVLDVLLFLRLWPATAQYWNPAAQLPWTAFGAPGFEVVFAGAFGILWPLVLAYVCDLTIEVKSTRSD